MSPGTIRAGLTQSHKSRINMCDNKQDDITMLMMKLSISTKARKGGYFGKQSSKEVILILRIL